jgi:hypothetical protein
MDRNKRLTMRSYFCPEEIVVDLTRLMAESMLSSHRCNHGITVRNAVPNDNALD